MKHLIWISILIILLPTPAFSTITYNFSGTVVSVEDNPSLDLWGDSIAVTDQFSGSFSYNPATITNPATGTYRHSPAGTFGISVAVSGNTFSQLPTEDMVIQIKNNNPTNDQWVIYAYGLTEYYPTYPVTQNIRIQLNDSTATIFNSSFDLPGANLSESDFDFRKIFVNIVSPSGGGTITSSWSGTINNLGAGEPIPEPGTLLLLGTGLAGLAGYGYRFRRKRKT